MQNFKHQKFYIIIYEYFNGENLVCTVYGTLHIIKFLITIEIS